VCMIERKWFKGLAANTGFFDGRVRKKIREEKRQKEAGTVT